MASAPGPLQTHPPLSAHTARPICRVPRGILCCHRTPLSSPPPGLALHAGQLHIYLLPVLKYKTEETRPKTAAFQSSIKIPPFQKTIPASHPEGHYSLSKAHFKGLPRLSTSSESVLKCRSGSSVMPHSLSWSMISGCCGHQFSLCLHSAQTARGEMKPSITQLVGLAMRGHSCVGSLPLGWHVPILLCPL